MMMTFAVEERGRMMNMTATDVIGSLSFAFIVLILLVLKDMQMELKQIRRELKRKDGEQE